MSARAVSGIMFALLLISMLASASCIQPVKSEPWTLGDTGGTASPKSHVSQAEADFADAFRAPMTHRSTPTFKPVLKNGWWELSNNAKLGNSACAYAGHEELVIGLSDIRPNSYLHLRDLIASNGGELLETVCMNGETRAVVVNVPPRSMPTFVSEVENANLSRYIEPNMSFEADFVPNDPDWPKQWGLAEIEAVYAWNITIGGPSVLVAIIDTGIDWNHSDLTANYVPLGYDWVNNDEQPMDDFGHGTHVAGIIAAVTNNGLGIAGLAQAKIMAEKVLDETGYGSSSDISQGIIHAVDRGAKIINLSLGSYDRSKLLHESVKYAYDHGVLIVAAAGNDATTAKCYPAAYDEVAAVSATDKLDNPAEFTNYGDWVDVAAPGVDVYSTLYSNSYAYMSGTSMASPHAAGVAALIWSRFPNMTRDQVWAQLQYSTDDLGEPGIDVHYGFGRINARKAVEQTPTGHDVLILNLRASLLTVNTTILNMGTNSEGNIMVQLLVNGSRVNSTIISFLASGASTMVSFSLSPDVQGLLNVTSYVVPLKGETMVENNALSAWMRLRLPLVIRVPEQYSTIQDAIDAANEEDTIFVASGVYYENVHIRKDSLRLIGEEASSTIIDGGGSKDVVLVWADHTEIRGFTVRNSGGNPSGNVPFSGVLVYDCENVNITDMVAANNWCGIFLYCSSNVELEGNRMAGNHFNFGVDGYVLSNFIHCIDESNTVEDKPICYIKNGNNRTVSTTAGCVLLVNSTNITVEKLELVHNHAGVFCLSSTNISVSSLKASWNNAGVYVRNCSSIIVRSSNLTENGFGILVEDSEKVTAKSNNINNSRSFGDGIKIIHSTKCQARLNVLTDNTCGLYLSYSSNNTVSSNVLRRNYIDLWLYCSNENVVSKNEASNSLLAGIFLTRAHNNLLTENCLLNNIELFYNSIALIIETSFNNSIYHNNFINNTHNVFIIDSANAFDDGYPAGGNYWSDYMDVDLYSGPYQNETGSDGIGDTPYAIDADNLDRYPIMSPWTPTPPVITASANIEPHTLNLKSRSEWIICHIELPEDYDVADINASTARLNDTIPADLNATAIGDCDNDGIPDLTAKFNRTAVSESILSQGIMLGNVTLTLTGKLYDDTGFEGSDVIEVRMPGDVNMDGKVRIADVLIVAQAFGTSASNPGNPPRWNPVADETGDGQIRVDDVLAVALNFGKTYV